MQSSPLKIRRFHVRRSVDMDAIGTVACSEFQTRWVRPSIVVDHEGTGTMSPSIIWSGERQCKLSPRFCYVSQFKHQNTPFQAKNSFYPGPSLLPKSLPQWKGYRIPLLTLHPLPPNKPFGSAPALPRIQGRFTPMAPSEIQMSCSITSIHKGNFWTSVYQFLSYFSEQSANQQDYGTTPAKYANVCAVVITTSMFQVNAAVRALSIVHWQARDDWTLGCQGQHYQPPQLHIVYRVHST